MPAESRRIGESADILAPQRFGANWEKTRRGGGDGNGNRERNAQVTGENGGGAYGRQAGSKRWAKKKTGGAMDARMRLLEHCKNAAHKTGKDRAGELSLKMVRQAIDQHGHFVERVSRAPTIASHFSTSSKTGRENSILDPYHFHFVSKSVDFVTYLISATAETRTINGMRLKTVPLALHETNKNVRRVSERR
ncbi:hypothetical protein WR25_15369 [Diploscapter pachys]|uniref:Uncharacterized protein n=1 Tax=Diploscapter pachys TaxID=2018661 RepID=A0A2A2L644_9BILA|nr:hypothetical protein WR25_15369 [Diploscapter pachys]